MAKRNEKVRLWCPPEFKKHLLELKAKQPSKTMYGLMEDIAKNNRKEKDDFWN